MRGALLASAVAGALLLSAPAHAQRLGEAGQSRVSLFFGTTLSGAESYVLAGLGFGHFVLAGLELGLQGDYWFGGDPSVLRLAPEVRYVFPSDNVLPYVGAFYRHWFIGGADHADYDTGGARVGLIYDSGGTFFLGGGAVYEAVLNGCDGEDCSYIYPEINIALIF